MILSEYDPTVRDLSDRRDLSEYDPIVLSTSVMKTFLITKYDIIFQSHILDPSLLWNICKISIDIDHPFFCIELSH